MTPEKLQKIYEFVDRFLNPEEFREFVGLMEDEDDGSRRPKTEQQVALDELPPGLRRRVVDDIERRQADARVSFAERWPSVARVA